MVIIGILLLVIIGLLVWYFFIRDSGTDEAFLLPLFVLVPKIGLIEEIRFVRPRP